MAIGAGGGTIAWVDAGGSLRCGPQSAGADPGPACLGSGNEQATITDAHLYLGRLNPDTYLGGDVHIDPASRAGAIERLAEQLGLEPTEAASGMLRIANANMTSATHLISVERGYDPREFAFVAGGGAGPLHAVDIAAELQIPHIVIARNAGVASALGILAVDLRHDFLRPVLKHTERVDPVELVRIFADMAEEAEAVLAAENIPTDRRAVELSLDVRYYGQTPYMNVKVSGPPSGDAAIADLVEQYGDAYEREFGYRLPVDVAGVEIVNARVAAIGLSEAVDLERVAANGAGAPEPIARRPVFFDAIGEFTDTPIFDRDTLRPGARSRRPGDHRAARHDSRGASWMARDRRCIPQHHSQRERRLTRQGVTTWSRRWSPVRGDSTQSHSKYSETSTARSAMRQRADRARQLRAHDHRGPRLLGVDSHTRRSPRVARPAGPSSAHGHVRVLDPASRA